MKITIIGAGAAGMMAAATLLERGVQGEDITLIDKNPKIGVKVALTGGGRCNVTTGITQRKELMPKYIRGADFLKHSFEVFGPRKVYQWFEDNGLPLYTQDDNRVFPRSNKGQDVVDVFGAIFTEKGVNMRLGEEVKKIEIEKKIVILNEEKDPESATNSSFLDSSLTLRMTNGLFIITTDKQSYESDILIIATGGNAYAHTGSSGDGYAFARSLGHTVTPLGPSLNSFEVAEDWCKDLSGLALQSVRFFVIANETQGSVPISNSQESQIKIASSHSSSQGQTVSVTGPMVFTHFGVSGPAVFALSAHLAHAKLDENNSIAVGISLDSSKDFQSWDTDIRIQCEKEPKKLIKNILAQYFPHRIVEVIMNIAGVDKECIATQFSKEMRKKIVHLLTGQLKITLTKRRAGDEFVTAGGVELSEVDPKTMQSKIVPRLYFGGEVLDIDAVTGGFNLQSAWATGRVAGASIDLI